MIPDYSIGSIGATSLSVAYTGTASTTSVLPSNCVCVRVMSTTDCYIAIGTKSTTAATTSGLYLPAYTPEYFRCEPSSYVSGIQVSTGGTLKATPMY